MAKYNIDDILSELGVDQPKAPAPAKKHRVDEAETPLSPIPSAPSNQGASTPPTGSPMGINEVYRPQADALDVRRGGTFTDVLLARGVLTPDRLTNAQQVIRQSPGRKLEEVLIEQGVDEVAVCEALAQAGGTPFERINLEKGLDGGFDGKLLQRLTPEFCKKNLVIPLRQDGSRVVVGTPHADNVFLVDEIRASLNVPGVKLVMVPAYDVRGALEMVGAGVKSDDDMDVSRILSEVEEGDVTVEKARADEVDLAKEAGESPVIRYVNYIIQSASKEGASDIHIEPAEKKLKVRFRIDGELFEMMNPPASMAAAITSRIKIMANLDISERRLPQDGRIRAQVNGRKLDLRVSTLPTASGEKVVMRILDQRAISVELENLGFDEETFTIWRKQIDSPHGIILVTGPTGSGKTTTLYASLRQLDKNSMNISTVEDPVEYHLDGITQTQVHDKIGMSFSAALRSLLRQDPDVIMLGEIRDHETAHIAVQAALTGHLVLSTLHTNDAPASITRLVNIGLEPFLVGAAVNAVLAQRLIRRLCAHCKQQQPATGELGEFLTVHGIDADEVWGHKGCDKCRNTGYSGRVGIYEMLAVDDQLRDMIARNPNVAEFRRLCIERGMVTLRQDGMRKVARGLTSVQEVLRVTEGAH